MDDILDPICRELRVNLLVGTGFESITLILQLLRRVQRHRKPAHILYVSDHDRAGKKMPIQVARQVQYWRETLGIDVEVTVEQVALTADQIRQYRLPHDPGEETRVELDALEALHPGVLADLVRHAVEPYRDRTLPGRLADAKREAAGQAASE